MRKARQQNQIHISSAIAQQQQQQYQQPQSYGGVNLIKPDGDIFIVPRELAPVHPGEFNAPFCCVFQVSDRPNIMMMEASQACRGQAAKHHTFHS